ncbi:calcium ion binding protein [Aureococcus anophagefferens]|nr:calcium ion binding protein [Aureococcus anophagefferens]
MSLWQVDDGSGEPYVYCEMPAVPVGSKAVNISAAGQDVYSKEDDAISFACADDYYCQEAGEAFLTSDCYDACDDPGIGGVDNCTVLTTVDEYCGECPLGSACDKHGTSLHTVKPYALAGYYRLDLGGADSDVACVEHREHRPHYCYDFFSWCIRGGAAAPALRFMFALRAALPTGRADDAALDDEAERNEAARDAAARDAARDAEPEAEPRPRSTRTRRARAGASGSERAALPTGRADDGTRRASKKELRELREKKRRWEDAEAEYEKLCGDVSDGEPDGGGYDVSDGEPDGGGYDVSDGEPDGGDDDA